MYPTMVELKAENLLLPKEDKDGMRMLLKHVAANCTDCNFEEIISKLTTVAQEQKKEDFWFQCLKSLVDKDPTDKVCVMEGKGSICRLKTDFSASSHLLTRIQQTRFV